MSTSVEDSSAWIQWLQTVDDEERMRVADLVSEHDTSDWHGLHRFLHALTVETIRGTLAPINVEMLKGLVDRQMAALFMEMRNAGNLDQYGNAATSTVLELRAAVKQIKPVQPRYIESVPNHGDVVDAFQDALPAIPKVGDGE